MYMLMENVIKSVSCEKNYWNAVTNYLMAKIFLKPLPDQTQIA